MLEDYEKIHNLIPEIVEDDNLCEAFDYIVKKLAPEAQRKIKPKKDAVIAELKEDISAGTFHIRRYRTMRVKDGPKMREVQAPDYYSRIGSHAIIAKFEKYVYPTLLPFSAASIKDRGMHYLHHMVEGVVLNADKTLYYYQCDIRHYYECIDQEMMMDELRRYTDDEVLLRIFHGFVHIMPQGLSKGMRSSQCFANLLLSPIGYHFDAKVKDYEGISAVFIYCDDIVFIADDKKLLWKWRDELKALLDDRKLEIKPNEAVRPLSVGLDFLGYVQFDTHSLLRKRIKQRFCRKMAKVKSRVRRQELVGSFKGMACHADCKHLYKTITGQTMKKFSELGVCYKPEDGKKMFPGRTVQLRSLVNCTVIVNDFETEMHTQNGDDRYIVSITHEGECKKFFTASKAMKQILDKVRAMEDGFPFETKIACEPFGDNKIKYIFT